MVASVTTEGGCVGEIHSTGVDGEKDNKLATESTSISTG